MYVEGMEFGKDMDSERCSVSSHGTKIVYSKAQEEVMEKTRTFAAVVANGGRTKVIGAKKGTKENEVNPSQFEAHGVMHIFTHLMGCLSMN
ncbi:hypothetical protein LWI29_037717 [Acer saccharum]|uniref:Uncharacterized protein n=1 Tax=Acer saccharum TaxID=4024 RepID=A0AA39T631_ACESA|nr:hypothetical protein LWI29_037717 [Acer saccharum]